MWGVWRVIRLFNVGSVHLSGRLRVLKLLWWRQVRRSLSLPGNTTAGWTGRHSGVHLILCKTLPPPQAPRLHYPSPPTLPPTSAPVAICRQRCSCETWVLQHWNKVWRYLWERLQKIREKSVQIFQISPFFLITTIKPHKALWIVQRDAETPGAASITSTINDVGNFRETNCVTKWYWPKVEFPVAWQHYLIQSHIRKRRELAMLWGRDAFPNSGTECNVRGQWSFSTILVWLSICARAILHNDMKSILNTFIVTGLRCPSERSVSVSWVVPVMPLQSREKLSCIYLPAAKVHLMSFYS